MSYYGYVKRGKDSQVDWGGITTGITDGLREISKEREGKRAELDQVNDDLMATTNDIEMGNSVSHNNFLLEGADEYKSFLLMQNKLLKQGLLKPSDYSKAMQNSKDSWSNLAKATKSFNADYTKAFEKLQAGEMPALEAAFKEKYMEFGNVQDKKMYVNPTDGRMYLATLDENGNIIKDPAKLLSVDHINNIANMDTKKFDVMTQTGKGAQRMAKVIESIRSGGKLTIDDARKQASYKEAKNDFLDSLMVNPNDLASILADGDTKYTLTENESEKGGNSIYHKPGANGLPVADLTPDQVTEARKILEAAFDVQLARIETPMPVYQPPQPQRDTAQERGWAREQKETSHAYNVALDIVLGNEKGLAASQAVTANPNSGVLNIVGDDQEIVVSYSNGDERRIQKILNGNALDHQTIAMALFNAIQPGATPAQAEQARKDFFASGEGSQYQTQEEFKPFGKKQEVAYKPLNKTLVRGPQGTPVSVENLLRDIPPGVDSAADVMSVLGNIDPGIEVDTSRWGWVPGSTDEIIIKSPMLGKTFTIDYEKEKHKANLLRVANQINEAIFAQQNQGEEGNKGGELKYEDL